MRVGLGQLLVVEQFFRGERTAEKEIVLIMDWVRVQDDAVTISHESEAYRWVMPKEALGITQHESFVQLIRLFLYERNMREISI